MSTPKWWRLNALADEAANEALMAVMAEAAAEAADDFDYIHMEAIASRIEMLEIKQRDKGGSDSGADSRESVVGQVSVVGQLRAQICVACCCALILSMGVCVRGAGGAAPFYHTVLP